MADIPDPAITNWVPIWNPLTEGPAGPTGPQGPPGPAGSAVPHHETHETGGTDQIVSLPASVITSGVFTKDKLPTTVAYTDQNNIFTAEKQTITGTDTPGLRIIETDQPVNRQKWRIVSYNGELFVQPLNDAETAETDKGYIFRRDGTADLIGFRLGTGNLVNHYSEGFWTPTLTSTVPATGVGYARQAGKYTKLNKRVFCWLDVIISTPGTGGSGQMQINLPFQSEAGIYQSALMGYFAGIAGSCIGISFLIPPSSSFALMSFKSVSSASIQDGALTWAALAVNTEFITSISYFSI